MDLVIAVSVAVIALAMLGVAAAMIAMAARVREAARQVERLAETARLQMGPVVHDLTVVSQEVRRVVQAIGDQVEKAGEGVTALRDTAVRLRDLERGLEQKIEQPLVEVAALLSGITKGFQAFRKIWRK
ncbi:MAG: hypothetical protein ONB23_12810 [candidate division KSB1 bacterium]|nr:hypothetical protein [candidate division KSB1 bacterium]